MVCRMCLQQSECTLYIFGDDSAKFRIAPTIAQHFWFEPKDNDSISTVICLCCWSKIETFHLYYLSVEEAQRQFTESALIKEELLQTEFLKKEPGEEAADTYAPDKTENEEPAESATGKFEFIGQDYEAEGDDDEGLEDDEDPREVDYTNAYDNFDTSDDEPLETLKTESRSSRRLKHDSQAKSSTDSSKPEENDPMSSNECRKKIILKKRGRKRKSEASQKKPSGGTEQRKKTNEYDEEIARQTTLKCDLCNSEFKLFAEMQRHYRSVHKVKGYAVCCATKFYNRSTFFNHMIKHVAPERLKCDKCDKIFSNKRALQNHTLIFHDPVDIKIFHCDQCPKRYAKQYQLNHHKKTHLEKNRTDFTCDECGKGNKYSLNAHKRGIHEKGYCRMCDICAKVLPSKALFIKHRLEHEGIFEPKAQCEECGRWLKNAFRLKLHMRTHNRPEVNRFECNECGKTAPSRSALQSHVRYVHTVERQYQCTFCDKAFKKPITLKEHMTTHTGDVLYTCPHCPKTFNSRANMHSHRKKKHPKEWEEARRTRGMPEELLNSTLVEGDSKNVDVDNIEISVAIHEQSVFVDLYGGKK